MVREKYNGFQTSINVYMFILNGSRRRALRRYSLDWRLSVAQIICMQGYKSSSLKFVFGNAKQRPIIIRDSMA